MPALGYNPRGKLPQADDDEGLWEDWRRVIRDGATNVKLRRIPHLVARISRGRDPSDVDPEVVRCFLFGVAAGQAGQRYELTQAHQSWNELTSVQRERWHLLRAGPDEYRDVTHARQLAIDAHRKTGSVSLYRSDDGREPEILRELVNATVVGFPNAPELPEESVSSRRSSGGAIKNAREAARSAFRVEPKLFWDRTSTSDVIDKLANSNPLTILVGSDDSFDGGALDQREVFIRALSDMAARHLPRIDQDARADAVQLVSMLLSPRELGSILRQLSAGDDVYRAAYEDALADLLARHVPKGTPNDQSLARAVTYLAFTKAKRHENVEVLSLLPKGLFDEAKRDRWKTYPWLRAVDFVDPGQSTSAGAVRLFTARGGAGDWEHSLVVGELDFEADPLLDERVGGSRMDGILAALEDRDVLFVGSRLDDPAILSALARTADSRRMRVALVTDGAHRETAAPESEASWSATRYLRAQRFLHLGVIPLQVENPSQVAQLLREVASKVERRDSYKQYASRFEQWIDALGDQSTGVVMANGDCKVSGAASRKLKAALTRVKNHAESLGPTDLTVELWLLNRGRQLMHQVVATRNSTEHPYPIQPWLIGSGAPATSGRLAADCYSHGHSTDATLEDGSFKMACSLVLYSTELGADVGSDRLPVGALVLTATGEDANALRDLLVAQAEDRGSWEERWAGELRPVLPELVP